MAKFSAITITGRRVEIDQLKAIHNKIILAGSKSIAESMQVARRLIDQLVSVPNGPNIWYPNLWLSEETDLCYLIRLIGLRKDLYFKVSCTSRACGHTADYHIDIRRFRRHLIQCSNDKCPCHDPDINQYSLDLLCENDDPRGMVDWSSIPADHLEKHPPCLEWTLEESGTAVVAHPLYAKDKGDVGEWMRSNDSGIICKALAKQIVSIDGNKFDDSKPATRERAIVEALENLTSYDLFQLRDHIESVDGGVDSTVDIKCRECDNLMEVNVPMGSSFFLPRTPSKDSSTSSSRSR